MTKSLRTDDDIYCELVKYDKYRDNMSDIIRKLIDGIKECKDFN